MVSKAVLICAVFLMLFATVHLSSSMLVHGRVRKNKRPTQKQIKANWEKRKKMEISLAKLMSPDTQVTERDHANKFQYGLLDN